jgi:apolipoprotein N-acyltransferase
MVAIALATTEAPTRPARALGLGWTTGAVYFGGTLYWVVGVMQTFGNLALPVAFLVGVLLASYLAIYPAIFAWLLHQSLRRFGLAGLWLAPFLWVATEWGRGIVVIGFPWALLGSSQATVLPVAQFSSVAGVYGLSSLVVLVGTAAAVVTLTRRRAHWIGAGSVVLFVVLVAAAGAWRIVSGGLDEDGVPLRVGLVQGSIGQEQKWDPRFRDEIMARYLTLSRQVIAEGAAIVIWPEAATPFYLDLNAELAAPIRRLAKESRTPFVVGTDDFVPGGGGVGDAYYNAAVLVDAEGRSVRTYRKMQLVPFGEYVPLKSLLFFVDSLVDAVSDFTAGTEPVVFDVDGRHLSVAICYESIYPEIARAFVAGGSQLLVTITNDAWFGLSSAAYQHFEQGILRAIEQGRYVVRAANTGITGAVDPYGRVIAATDLFVPAAVTVDVRLQDYRTIYSRTGDLAVWLGLAATLWVLVAGRTPRSPGRTILRNGTR